MRPVRLNASIAILFVVGSACFVLGSVPAYINAVGGVADSLTYFVGSIFFTSASFLQLLQSENPSMTQVDDARQNTPEPVAIWRWLPYDRSWLAAITQFPGTLFFNISTLAALAQNATSSSRTGMCGGQMRIRLDAFPRGQRVRHPGRRPLLEFSAAISPVADRVAEHDRIHSVHGIGPGQLRAARHGRSCQRSDRRPWHSARRSVLLDWSRTAVPGVEAVRAEPRCRAPHQPMTQSP